MDHDLQLRKTSSTAAGAARDTSEPGRSSRSAMLCKCDRAIASGLIKPFTPPERGIATTAVNLRVAPTARATSAVLKTLAADAVMSVRSEVQSADVDNPKWFGVEIDQLDGFVAAPYVRIDASPPDVPVPGIAADDPLFSGPLEQMRIAGEFDQYKGANTIHRACMEAFKQNGYRPPSLEADAVTFRKNACNLQALFFIERSHDLRSEAKTRRNDYPGYMRLVEDWMTTYFAQTLRDQRVRPDGKVLHNDPLNQDQGCDEGWSPYQKAQGLLKCAGRLIRICTGGHYFLGKISDGALYTYDNNRREDRSKRYDGLKDITPETTSGPTYKFLKDTLKSASPEKASHAADADERTGSAAASPHAAPESHPPVGDNHATAFAPPKLGVITENAIHRAGPTTASARLGGIAAHAVVAVHTEVQTTDPAHPRWFGVEVDKRQGFVATSLVKIEDKPKDTEPTAAADHAASSAGSEQAAAAPPVGQAPGMKPDGPLFSGHLARMRRENEFLQIAPEADGRTLHKASTRALETRGYTGKTLASKAKVFRDAACNIMALFFIERAPDLRSRTEALQSDYAGYRQLVEDWMATYFTDALHSGLVKESAWVTSNEALDQSEGCGSKDTPYQKAQGLLKCEGKLIRIHVAGHFFAGEVTGGVLHAYDNQGDSKKRSGEFDLKEVAPDSKSGKTYQFLRDVLVSASPEKGGASRREAGNQVGSSPAQPSAAAADAQACEC